MRNAYTTEVVHRLVQTTRPACCHGQLRRRVTRGGLLIYDARAA